MKHLLLKTLSFIPAMLLLSGCGNDDVAGDADGQQPTELRFRCSINALTRADTQATTLMKGEKAYFWVDAIKDLIYPDAVKAWELTSDGENGFDEPAEKKYFPEGSVGVDVYSLHGLFADGAIVPGETAFPSNLAVHVAADQRATADYAKSDFLFGVRTGVKRTDGPIEMKYYHLFSKVEIALKAGDGVDPEALKQADVRLLGVLTAADFKSGDVTEAEMADSGRRAKMLTGDEDSRGEVAVAAVATDDYSDWGEAVVVPQAVPAGNFIAVSLPESERPLYFALPSDKQLETGKKYRFEILVEQSELKIDGQTVADWAEGQGESGAATEADAVGTFVNPRQAKVGDYYMNDGSFVHATEELTDKQKAACIGIVFDTGRKRIGDKANETFGLWGHGLVMALTNTTDKDVYFMNGMETMVDESGEQGDWGAVFDDNVNTVAKMYADVDGYAKTHWIYSKIANSGGAYDDDSYSGFASTRKYGMGRTYRYKAPAGTTGWFVPSMGHLWDIFANLGGLDNLKGYQESGDESLALSDDGQTAIDNINAKLEKIPGSEPFELFGYYLSSSEYDTFNVALANVGPDGALFFSDYYKFGANYRVRAVLAF